MFNFNMITVQTVLLGLMGVLKYQRFFRTVNV